MAEICPVIMRQLYWFLFDKLLFYENLLSGIMPKVEVKMDAQRLNWDTSQNDETLNDS